MEKYPLIIEKDSNYAFVIKESKKLTFDLIRKYSTEFYRMLPNEIQERLYDEILHGACELDSEPKLNAYMYALGKMHNAKLYKAYSNLSDEFRNEKTIDIIDYGCGQGMGCISYSDFLRENNLQQKVRRIILIEPSKKALERAALNVSAMYPKTEHITINKGFDDLCSEDLFPDKDIPTLHIISNVLDMATTCDSDGFFDLENFANLISTTIDGKNEFVCVEPLFAYEPKDEKVDAFINKAGINTYYTLTKGKGEFVNGKDWTCVIRVGKVYKGMEINENKILCYTILAEQGDASAQFNLGYCYDKGLGVEQDYEKAVEWYTKSAEQGNAYAQNNLGYCYDKGLGVEQDYEKAVEWYTKSAEQGNASAQNNLGICYENGDGVEQDYEKAVFWYRKSAEQGDSIAQFNLGCHYAKGDGVEQDYEKAVFWCRKSAEQGNASAQYNLALCYVEGQRVEQDFEKAVFWYRKSAEQGNASAQNNIGICYENGEGVEQDYEKAVFWYKKSAEQGNANAQNNLGVCYKNGEGVEQDYEKAVFWYRKSAEQGNAKAQNNLGVCYKNGEGVEQDYEKASFWYRKSAEQGNEKAQDNLKIIEKIKRETTKINGHEYVDLGLPSGLKWATCNVGANSPEEYGDYYAWGETETKDEYTEENCYTCGEEVNDISGNPKYDVARKKWGGEWRMPTYYEMEELIEKCSWEWIEQNGTNGYKVTGPNGNSIFLPAAGYRNGSSLYYAGSLGCYRGSTPYESDSYDAYNLSFYGGEHYMGYGYRYNGRSVRPVLE